MAGNEQRPTDDVEAHRYRWGQDTEAVDEDQVADDTEGHMPKRWGGGGQDTEATDEDEAGGGDDTGGHAVKYRG
ncbi:MAG TPA: hypothetical protein VL330_01235 [Actinomycetes bacterium]|nr:hypothetical protein [Actinomycetes bacterium]